jgi:hypothetical protein
MRCLLIALALTGTAHAEQFGLECKGVETLGSVKLEWAYKLNVDTDAQSVKRFDGNGEWEATHVAVKPTAIHFMIRGHMNTLDRVTGKLNADGTCTKVQFVQQSVKF